MFIMPATKHFTLLCAILALLVLSVAQVTESFSLEKMCEARCSYGRGGHLCNCNAFHFAGKRAGERYGGHSVLDLDDDDIETNQLRDATQQLVDASRHHMFAVGGELLPKSDNSEASARKDNPYKDRVLGHAGNRHSDNSGENDDVMVEGFIGVESGQRSEVHRLASLLKDAISERLAENNRKSRRWQSDVPYEENGVLF